MPSLRPRTSLSSTRQGTPAVEGGTDAESQLSSSQAKGASMTAPNTGAATTVDASALLLQTLSSMQTMFDRQMRQQQELMTRLLESQERRHQPQASRPHDMANDGPRPPRQRHLQPPRRPLPHQVHQPAADSDTDDDYFDHANAHAAVLQSVVRQPNVKPDDISLFDGSPDKLEFFRSRVEALIQSRSKPGWEQAVIETLPLCLRDSAAQWYQLMGFTQRAGLNAGWSAWEAALLQAFRPDDGEARRIADSRKWNAKSEMVQQYFYSKLVRGRVPELGYLALELSRDENEFENEPMVILEMRLRRVPRVARSRPPQGSPSPRMRLVFSRCHYDFEKGPAEIFELD